jgi:hypothetical protein
MKKEIIEIDKSRGVYQITTTDERWYTETETNTETGLPFFKFIPSVTWITSYVYKGVEFYKWLASKGWDEAEAIKSEAGDKGSKIHNAVDQLIKGGTIKMEDKFNNINTDNPEDLKPEEYSAVNSFVRWYNEVKPEFILNETTVISKEFNFAGTVDCVAKIGDQIWIIDWKSSQYIWPSMEAQISAYKQAFKEMGRNTTGIKLAVLQLGYKKNKRGYKFTEIEDKFEDLFLPARKFWESATKNQSPKQYELPLELSLNLPKLEMPKDIAKMDTVVIDSENPPTPITTILPEIEIGDKKVATVDEVIVKPKKKYKSKKK